jgi:putative Holliday junction resolvase
MKALALDIGEKRTGIASGDTDTRIALPVCVLNTHDILSGSADFKRLVQEVEPEFLVVGLPVSLDAQENRQAQQVRKIAENIAKTLDLPLIYQDERLSSAQARRYFREAGYTEKEMRGRIDMVAASLILQTYLDACISDPSGDARSERFPH